MLEIVKQEIRHHQSLMDIANESEEMFERLAEIHCDDFSGTVDEFDGEHIKECKHSAHPYASAKGALAECTISLCPLCK